MSCGCKSKNIESFDSVENTINDFNSKSKTKIDNIIGKSLTLLIVLLSSPFLFVIMLYVLSKTIITNESLNLLPLLLAIGKRLKKLDENQYSEDEDEEEDIDDLDENDFVIEGLEVIDDVK